MTVSHTDRVGTEAEKVSDRIGVLKLYDQVPKAYQNEMIVRLPYCYHSSYSLAQGLTANQFKVNSIFDPDLTGISGNYQPTGRDTWAAIYNYYKVLEVKIYYQFGLNQIVGAQTDYLNGGADSLPVLVGGMLDLTANPPPSMTSWLCAAELGQANRQQIFSPISLVSPIVGDVRRAEVRMDWNPTLFETAILDQSTKDTWTPVGSDPDNLEYFSFLMQHNGPNNSKGTWFRLHIEYMVSFKQVNRSLLNTLN